MADADERQVVPAERGLDRQVEVVVVVLGEEQVAEEVRLPDQLSRDQDETAKHHLIPLQPGQKSLDVDALIADAWLGLGGRVVLATRCYGRLMIMSHRGRTRSVTCSWRFMTAWA